MPGLEDEFGDVVRKARSGLGLTIEQLAGAAGLSDGDIKGIEVYTKHPDQAQVRRLAAELKLRPDQLWEMAEDSWSAQDGPWTVGQSLTIERLTNHYPEHCYLVSDRDGRCLIVDPGAEAERIIAASRAPAPGGGLARQPQAILITHFHQDHTGAVVPVQAATGVPVHIHQADLQGVNGVPEGAVKAFDGDGVVTSLGPSLAVRVLHTPGHSAGSATFVIEVDGATAAFCGDTLFAGSIGNARAGYDAILHSVRRKICALPGQTVLYPGHGPATTVANEQARNPFL